MPRNNSSVLKQDKTSEKTIYGHQGHTLTFSTQDFQKIPKSARSQQNFSTMSNFLSKKTQQSNSIKRLNHQFTVSSLRTGTSTNTNTKSSVFSKKMAKKIVNESI